MKAYIFFFLLLLSALSWTTLPAQQKTVLIQADDYDKLGIILLENLEGWQFHPGFRLSWMEVQADTSHWQNLKMSDISIDLANEKGFVEGWFRLHLKVDHSISEGLRFLDYANWAAVELYIDGNLIRTFGSLEPYQQFPPISRSPFPVDLEPGLTYTLALRWRDQISPVNAQLTKSEELGMGGTLYFANEQRAMHIRLYERFQSQTKFANMLIMLILCLFLRMMVILKIRQENLTVLAVYLTLGFIGIFFNYLGSGRNEFISYEINYFSQWMEDTFGMLNFMVLLLIIMTIIKDRLERKWAFFVLGYWLVMMLLQNWAYIALSLLLLYVTLIFYHILVNRGRIKGVKWIIIIGFITNLIMSMLFFFLVVYQHTEIVWYGPFLAMSLALIIPFSILIYVALRYKEILNEVEKKSGELLQVTEEKQEILRNQNKVLEQQVLERTEELNASLDNLKSTQAQLIQSEKLASLGELTAGIAHEIQNPLNFVNNFSEVNAEMLIELKEELEKGDLEEVKALTQDLQDNEAKILHHGKRADAIVKNMLEHSRKGTGEKTLTDLNALAEEYLRLAYHGLRAKDKSFNADYENHLDENLPKVKVVSQDLSRVLLNLINNAFYAVHQKAQQKIAGYQPKVTIHSELKQDQIILQVQDNGTGMPNEVKEKIFQPFFYDQAYGARYRVRFVISL